MVFVHINNSRALGNSVKFCLNLFVRETSEHSRLHLTGSGVRRLCTSQFFKTNLQERNMGDKLDIIILGATGFTGKNTIPPVAKVAKEHNLKWAVAGRNEKKLKDILAEMGKKTGEDFSSVKIIEADISNEESLKTMAENGKVIVNTVGPYRFYGEQVVKACINAGAHHVDVSGEPQYMERMQLEYHEEAKKKGVYVISACGFDSIPSDLGVIFTQNKFPGVLNSVETYLRMSSEHSGPSINYGTWESAVYGLAHNNELKGLRAKLFPKKLPVFKPKLQFRGNFHKCDDEYALPFLGSDKSVVQRSQRYLYEEEKKRPTQIQTYFCIQSLLAVIVMVFVGGIFSLLTKLEFGRKLLLQYPGFFSLGFISREGPSVEKMENTKFSVTIVGEGWTEPLEGVDDQYTTPPNKQIITKVSGVNPGYGATTMALTMSALMILKESSKMPSSGGVYPPGAAFAKTSIIDKLNDNGLTYEVLSMNDI